MKIPDSKMTGFINAENKGDKKLKEGKSIKCVIIDIDTEKGITDLLPINEESKVKSKSLVGQDGSFKIISVKEDYTILSHSTYQDKIAVGPIGIGAHNDVLDGIITD